MAEFVFVEKKPMDGREHALDTDITIGREGCDVVLPDPEVSRRHAAVRVTAGGAAVEDLGSSNGTFVNGNRVVGTQQLKEGDRLQFGNTEWELRAAATASVGAPQLTAARAVPQQPPPAAPQPAAPAAPPQPAAGQAAAGPRGDVPAPADITPSAIRRTLPPEAAQAPPAFTPVGTRGTKGSAATRAGYTAFCFAVFLATLAAVAIYFIVN